MKIKVLIKKVTMVIITLLISFMSFSQELRNSKDLITGELSNGVRYYFIRNEFPKGKVRLNLVVDSGSLNETITQLGGAHYLEHMAFNGTEKFPKNEIIKYLESIGLRFGRDLNAYTSFEETVYKLEIPNTKKDLEIALDILHQWGYHITIDKEEVENERGVIIEEWRGRRGLQDRIFQSKWGTLFKESILMDRLPIGTFESISGLTQNDLREFYENWYTPENMSIIVIGDMEEEEVVTAIKNRFSISPREKRVFNQEEKDKIPSSESRVAIETKDEIRIFRDKEITTSGVSFSSVNRVSKENTKESLKNDTIEGLFFRILNSRINQLTREENTPIISGSSGSYILTTDNKISDISITFKENEIEQGYRKILNLFRTLKENGPNINEFQSEKTELLSQLRFERNNSDSRTSESIMRKVQNLHRYGKTYLNSEDNLKIIEEILKEITMEDIHKYGISFFNGNKLRFFTLPLNENNDWITEEKIREIEIEVEKEVIQKWESIDKIPLEVKKGLEGEIVSKEIMYKGTPFEHTVFMLSNGIRVSYKKTDFERDKIYFNFFKKQGSSILEKEGYINAIFTSYMLSNSGIGNLNPSQSELYMKGKNIGVSSFISQYTEGFTIISDNENLNNALDVLTAYINNPRFDDAIFNNLINMQKDNIENRENSPTFHLSRAIQKGLYGDENFRKLPITESELSLVTREGIEKIYRKKLSDFEKYNLVVVGGIEEKELERILVEYFSTFQRTLSEEDNANGNKEGLVSNRKLYKEVETEMLKGNKKVVITKGKDSASRGVLIFPIENHNGDKKVTKEKMVAFNAFNDILRKTLLEEIREKNSNIYSISSELNYKWLNFGDNFLRISFTTSPELIEKVMEDVKKQVFLTLNGNFSHGKIDDIVMNYKVNFESELRKNSYWTRYLFNTNFEKYDENSKKIHTPEEYAEFLTRENILKLTAGFINKENYLEVILNPEVLEEKEEVETEK